MSKQGDLAAEVRAIIVAKRNAEPSYFALAFEPEIQYRVDQDAPPVGTRKLYVQPVGLTSSKADRGNTRDRSFFIDLVFIESIPGNPMSPAGLEWLEQRTLLIEQIEDIDFSDIESASWEETNVVDLLYESPAVDEDQIFFQVVRLEFSE